MNLGAWLKVFSALVSWLGVEKTLNLFAWGRRLRDEVDKMKRKLEKDK